VFKKKKKNELSWRGDWKEELEGGRACFGQSHRTDVKKAIRGTFSDICARHSFPYHPPFLPLLFYTIFTVVIIIILWSSEMCVSTSNDTASSPKTFVRETAHIYKALNISTHHIEKTKRKYGSGLLPVHCSPLLHAGMEHGKADVTAFQLAAELASSSPTPASTSLPPHLVAENSTHAGARGDVTQSSGVGSAKRRGRRSNLHYLLDEQRNFTSDGGATVNQRGCSTGRSGSLRPVLTYTTTTTAATSTALREAMLRWGLVNGEQGSAIDGITSRGARSFEGGDVAPSSAFPVLRHSWRLVDCSQRPASADDRWSLGQRWERADDVVQDNALLEGVQREITRRHAQAEEEGGEEVSGNPNTTDRAHDSFYAAGLQLCAQSVCSGASLPACVAAASMSSVSFFTFTEDEYNALTQPPPPPLPPSTFCFTYASSTYLFTLWFRFGNAVVVHDRWASRVANHSHATPIGEGPASKATEDSGEGAVPSVEQICAEYSRVITGVLQQRQQRLMEAVQGQQSPSRQQGTSRAPKSAVQPNVTTAITAITATAAAATGSPCPNSGWPFIPSFDRYALLHSAKDKVVERNGRRSCSDLAAAGKAAESALLPSQPSPPPIDSDAATSVTAVTAVPALMETIKTAEPAHPSSPPDAPLSMTSALTPSQRFTSYITPQPWYVYSAEVRRRTAVATLLRCEGATNVPYQHAASKYLAVAMSAAQALQRASYVFDERDRVEQREKEGRRGKWVAAPSPQDTPADGAAACGDSDDMLYAHTMAASDGCRATPLVPPRSAFTVRLQPLPGVDPAAWKAAEAALRKAAVEVLGTTAAASSNARVKESCPTHHSRSSGGGTGGKRSRSHDLTIGGDSDGAVAPRTVSRHAGGRGKGKESVRATFKRTKAEISRLEAVGGGGAAGLDEGSNEFSLRFSSNSSDSSDSDGDSGGSKADESQYEEDVTASSDSDEGDGDAATHLSRENAEGDGDCAENEEGRRRAEGRLGRPPQQRHRRGRGAWQHLCGRSPSLPMLPTTPHLSADPTYRALQEYMDDVMPFRCTRLRVAVQAGWMLPPPPPLPHLLTEPLDESEVVLVDVQAALRQGGAAEGNDVTLGGEKRNEISNYGSPSCGGAASVYSPSPPPRGASLAKREGDEGGADRELYQPILTEDDYQALRRVSNAAVCNRVVSHTGEAVLLSLPPTIPRLHREVEQELERHLYDDTSAMMEVNAEAQLLVAAIRIAYSQNTYLHRYTARLEHVVDNLRKVEQDCRDARKDGA
jgi:hypothetical protein